VEPPRLTVRIRHTANAVWRRIRWILLTVLALELFYLVVGNGIIWFVLRQEVNKDVETKMEYGFAYSVWPTVIHVRDFRVSNHDSAIEWTIFLKQADVTVDLFALAQQKFHARRIRAEGVTFHSRQRLNEEQANDPRSRLLAPVPPFADPPMIPIGPPKRAVSDRLYNLWTADLDDIECGVDEVWVDAYRMFGKGRLAGAFYFKPLRMLVLEPTFAKLEGIELRIGEEPLLRDVHGTVAMRISAYDPREDNAVLARSFSADIHFGSQIPSLRALGFVLSPKAPMKIDDGSGELRIDATLERGRLKPRSTLRYETDDVRVDVDKFTVNSAAIISMRTVSGGPDGQIEVDAAIRRATVRRGKFAPAVVGGFVGLRGVDADLLAPQHPHGFAEGVATLSDLRFITDGPKSDDAVRILGGSGRAFARVDVDANGTARGNVRADAKRASFAFADATAGGDLRTEIHVDGANLKKKSARVTKSFVEAEGVEIARGGAPTSGSARVDVAELVVDEGKVKNAIADVEARLANVATLFGAPKPGAKIAFRAGAAHAKAHVEQSADGKTKGGLEATIRDAVIGVPGSNIVANVSTHFGLEDSTLDPIAIHARKGRILVSGVGVGKAGAAPADRKWWADIDLPAIDFGTPSAPTFDVRAVIRCRDGRAPLEALADAGTVPGWVGTLFPVEGLAGQGELRRDASGLLLRFGAAGGGATAKGALLDRGPGLNGEILVADGIVKAGIELKNGKPSFKLFAGEGWLRERINALAMQP
jgi:hypothetical protein